MASILVLVLATGCARADEVSRERRSVGLEGAEAGDRGLGVAFLDGLPVSPTDKERIAHSNAESLLRL